MPSRYAVTSTTPPPSSKELCEDAATWVCTGVNSRSSSQAALGLLRSFVKMQTSFECLKTQTRLRGHVATNNNELSAVNVINNQEW